MWERILTYEIQPEKEGTTLDTKKVQKVIRKAISAGDKSVSLEKTDCYKKPSVYKDDATLKKDCDQMNKLTSCVIFQTGPSSLTVTPSKTG